MVDVSHLVSWSCGGLFLFGKGNNIRCFLCYEMHYSAEEEDI